MPFYEYVCTRCGATLEILQKISDPPATECRVCHEAALVKQVSAAGFRLKGGGWYETDFKSGDKRNLVGDAGGDSSKASESAPAAAPSSTESKPASGGTEKTAPAPTAKPAESKAVEKPKKSPETKGESPKKSPDAGKTAA